MDKQNDPKKTDAGPQKPLDKAEGDEETVDESLRIHEEKEKKEKRAN